MNKNKYRNYYIGIGIAIVLIISFLFGIKMYQNKLIAKYENSYLVSSGAVSLSFSKLNEIEQVFSEAPEDYFVFITYTKDENEYKLEKKLKTIIDNYGLKDTFYIIDITKEKNDDDLDEKLNNKLKLNKDRINSVPIIIYFEKDSYKIIDPNKLQNFLEKNEFEKVSQ